MLKSTMRQEIAASDRSGVRLQRSPFISSDASLNKFSIQATTNVVLQLQLPKKRRAIMSQPPQAQGFSVVEGDSSSESVLMEERQSSPPPKYPKQSLKRPHSPRTTTRTVHYPTPLLPVTQQPTSPLIITSPSAISQRRPSQDQAPVVQFIAPVGPPASGKPERAGATAFSTQFVVHPSSSNLMQPIFMPPHSEVMPGAYFPSSVTYPTSQAPPRFLPAGPQLAVTANAFTYSPGETAFTSTTPNQSWAERRPPSMSSSTDKLPTPSSIGSAPGVSASGAHSPRHPIAIHHDGGRIAAAKKEYSQAMYHSTGSVSSTATNSGVGGYQGAQNKMAPTADVMTYPAHATPSYSIGQGYTITLPGTQFEPVITVPYPGPIPNISSGPAIRLPALPRPDEGHCQAGGELRLSHMKHRGQKIHVPAGCALVGCRSPQLGQTTLLATVDKRYLPDPHTGSNVQGFHGNCIGCGKTGFHFFTDFCTHINLRLNTQPKKQKHIRYYIDMDEVGTLKTGAVVPWKGSSTLLLFTSGTNTGAAGSETDDAISPEQRDSISSNSSGGRGLMRYKSTESQPKRGYQVPSQSQEGAFQPTQSRIPPLIRSPRSDSQQHRRLTISALPESNSPTETIQQQQPQQPLASCHDPPNKEEKRNRTHAILLPCFGHDPESVKAIAGNILVSPPHNDVQQQEQSTSSPQVIYDILQQPLSTVHNLCLQHRRSDTVVNQDRSDLQQASDYTAMACFLLGSFLVSHSASGILLKEAFGLYMYQGLKGRRRLDNPQSLTTDSLLSMLSSLAASSNGTLTVHSSAISLLDASRQTCLSDNVHDRESGAGCRPDFSLCIYLPHNNVFGMEVCVILHSPRHVKLLEEEGAASQVSDPQTIHRRYEGFVDIQVSLGLSQQDNLSVQQLPFRTCAAPSDPGAQLNLPSLNQNATSMSPVQRSVAAELAQRCHEQINQRLEDVPDQRFTAVDFIIMVRQSCPVYVNMVQKLMRSPAMDQLLKSRGLPATHSAEVARERVICVDEDESMAALQLSKLEAYARRCPQTLFLVIAKDSLKSPRNGGCAFKELDDLLLLANTIVIASMMSHYSWLASDSLLPPSNVVQLQVNQTNYSGTESLLGSYTWKASLHADQRQRWTVDEQFESALNILALEDSRAQALSESEMRVFLLLQEYVLAWDQQNHVAGHQQRKAVSSVASEIVSDLVQSRAPVTSVVRVPNIALASFFWHQLCSLFHSQESGAQNSPTDDIILALYDGHGPIRVSHKIRGNCSFLSPESPRPPSASSTIRQSLSQVSCFGDLPAGHSLVIVSGCVTSLQLPSNTHFVDYRAHGNSYLTRAGFREEMSLMAGYTDAPAAGCGTPTPAATKSLPQMAVLSSAMLRGARAISGHESLAQSDRLIFGINNLLPCERVQWVNGLQRHPLDRHNELDEDSTASHENEYYNKWCELQRHENADQGSITMQSHHRPNIWLLSGPAKSGKTAVLLDTLRIIITNWPMPHQQRHTRDPQEALLAAGRSHHQQDDD